MLRTLGCPVDTKGAERYDRELGRCQDLLAFSSAFFQHLSALSLPHFSLSPFSSVFVLMVSLCLCPRCQETWLIRL